MLNLYKVLISVYNREGVIKSTGVYCIADNVKQMLDYMRETHWKFDIVFEDDYDYIDYLPCDCYGEESCNECKDIKSWDDLCIRLKAHPLTDPTEMDYTDGSIITTFTWEHVCEVEESEAKILIKILKTDVRDLRL